MHGATESEEFDELSVQGKFPAGTTGNSLSRIRKTINEYAMKLTDTADHKEWYPYFKTGTVKALERRFIQHETNVLSSMHIDTMKTFKVLVVRIQALLGRHRACVK